jgi:hypothetical protein
MPQIFTAPKAHLIIIFFMVEADKVQAAWTPPVTVTWGQNNFAP